MRIGRRFPALNMSTRPVGRKGVVHDKDKDAIESLSSRVGSSRVRSGRAATEVANWTE